MPQECQTLSKAVYNLNPWQENSPNLGVNHHFEMMTRTGLHSHAWVCWSIPFPLWPTTNFTPWYDEALIYVNCPMLPPPGIEPWPST